MAALMDVDDGPDRAIFWFGLGDEDRTFRVEFPLRSGIYNPHALARFWGKVAIGEPDECWPYLEGTYPSGYGRLSAGGRGGRQYGAHRYAFRAVGLRIPARHSVLHSCDNPPCCNPGHLRAGTPAENSADMVSRGRQAKGARARGNFKLTPEQVVYVRTCGKSLNVLARELGIAKSTLSYVRNGRTWRDVAEAVPATALPQTDG